MGLVVKWTSSDQFPRRCLLQYTSRGVAVEKSMFPLKLQQLSTGFILLLSGYLIALICFAGEISYFKLTGP